jgi:hypothetical protein
VYNIETVMTNGPQSELGDPMGLEIVVAVVVVDLLVVVPEMAAFFVLEKEPGATAAVEVDIHLLAAVVHHQMGDLHIAIALALLVYPVVFGGRARLVGAAWVDNLEELVVVVVVVVAAVVVAAVVQGVHCHSEAVALPRGHIDQAVGGTLGVVLFHLVLGDLLGIREEVAVLAAEALLDIPGAACFQVEVVNYQKESMAAVNSSHCSQTHFRPLTLLAPKNLIARGRKSSRISEPNQLLKLFQAQQQYLLDPRAPNVCPAAVALVTTCSLATSTASRVRLLNPRIPVHAELKAPRTADAPSSKPCDTNCPVEGCCCCGGPPYAPPYCC